MRWRLYWPVFSLLDALTNLCVCVYAWSAHDDYYLGVDFWFTRFCNMCEHWPSWYLYIASQPMPSAAAVRRRPASRIPMCVHAAQYVCVCFSILQVAPGSTPRTLCVSIFVCWRTCTRQAVCSFACTLVASVSSVSWRRWRFRYQLIFVFCSFFFLIFSLSSPRLCCCCLYLELWLWHYNMMFFIY